MIKHPVLLNKMLVIGVIILFIGIGVQPAFAVVDKASTESFTIDNENENPIIVYEDYETGEIKQEKFDMVVLATCIIPPVGVEKLAETLGIELDKYHFVKTTPFIPVETSKEGIFTCGCVHEPMDIPRSVAEASGAAARASEVIRGG